VVTTKMELLELLSKAEGGDVDFLREGVRVLAQALMEVEVSGQIGAAHSQRTPQRATYRNGYRPRDWDTRAGTVELQIPKLRQGSYFPSLLEPRRRAERALAAVVAQCYVEGVSTRRVDDIARQMGLDGISKSQVSRVCAELDEVVAAWRNRPLDAGPYPFVWVDALSMKVREGGRVCNTAVLVATACNADGHRELLGLELGSAEDGASWTAFLRGLVARGLQGSPAGHKRRPPRVEGRDRGGAGGRLLAALQDPFHAQPPGHRTPARAADGRLAGPHDLRPGTPPGRLGAA
jgi:putative transposase